MAWFKKFLNANPELESNIPAPPRMSKPTTPVEDGKFSRHKDYNWTLKEGVFSDPPAISIQVLQDLRDELKLLNARLNKMDENFRIVFGIEEEEP